jgi:hypothetical protein
MKMLQLICDLGREKGKWRDNGKVITAIKTSARPKNTSIIVPGCPFANLFRIIP